MKKMIVVTMAMALMMILSACSDDYISVVQERATEDQEVARITMVESDHLIRGYMVSEEGVAAKVVQILEMNHEGEPYRLLVEIDPIGQSFVGFADLEGESEGLVAEWHQSMVGLALDQEIPLLEGTDLDGIWMTAVEEAQANALILVKDE
jgi:hypothetical protein